MISLSNYFFRLKEQNFWTKETLLFSSSFPALLNIASQFFALQFFGVSLYGQWLIWKTTCQLTANLNPGFTLSQTILFPFYESKPQERQKLQYAIYRIALQWFALSTLLATLVCFLIFTRQTLLALSLVFFWMGLQADGFTGAQARGLKKGGVIAGASLSELVGVLLSLYAATLESMPLFVAAQGLRSWTRALLQYQQVTAFNLTKTQLWSIQSQAVQVGFPLMVRGWLQATFQYGDKLIVGALFGAFTTGVIGIGGLAALPTVMLASATAAWFLPLVVSNNIPDHELMFLRQIALLLGTVVVMTPLLSFLPLVLDVPPGQSLLIYYSYLHITLLSLFTPLSQMIIAQGKRWTAVALNSFVFTQVLLVFVVGSVVGWPIQTILVASGAFLLINFIAGSLFFKIVSRRRLFLIAMLTIFCTIETGYWAYLDF
jgi:hypothetical protein